MKFAFGFLGLALGLSAACATTATQPLSGPIKAIMCLEDMRTIGPGGELLQYLANPDAAIRERAAIAVGRLRTPNGGEPTTAKLIALIDDPEVSVRAAAAFALGSRGDASASSVLILHGTGAKADASALVRARLIEAASKLEEPVLLAQYLTALEDPAAEVRLEAVAGTARWKTDTKASVEIHARVAGFVAKERDLRARTYGLFALERRKAKEGRDVFLKSASASDVDERLFAVRGLANLGGDLAIDAALIAASRDKDWRIAFEALQGLGKSSARLSLEAMAAAASLENHHLRVAAIESATAQFDAFAKTEWMGTTPGVGRFDPSWAESSPAVRAAAMANMFQVTPEPALNADPSPHVRAALIRQHGRESRATTTPYFSFDEIESETDPLVLGAYIERWGELPDYEGPVDLPDYLGYADNGIRLAAVNALLARKQPKVEIGALARCYETSKGEVSTEVRFNLLKLAAKIGGDGALQLLERGMSDEDAYVRRTAYEELAKITGKSSPWTDKPLPAVELAFPGEGWLSNLRPHVVISTDRGEMEFVLFADEAPQHVYNLLKHADFYKGTTFHRVVSDFVAQGGDARGDGNGGSSWRGDALRNEITPRKYIRGSLGMPRNEDWDSGGSQIFITHRMTPHLDGRYTIFGELVKGFDVLDQLDLGDKILEVRVLR